MHVLWVTWIHALPNFLLGLKVTLEITGLALVLALVLGFVLALGRLSGVRVFEFVAMVFVEVIRAIPVLVLLFVAYYSMGQWGVKLSGFAAGTLTLGVFYATQYGEIFRGGILAVDRGQREAAQALGLSSTAIMGKIILPQAFFNILPPATNQLSNLIKDTSLVYTISVTDLMFQAYLAGSNSFQYMDDFLLAGVLYFAFYIILSKLLARWELNVQRRRA